MDSREDQHAAEHGLKGRHPEITAVGQPVASTISIVSPSTVSVLPSKVSGITTSAERLRPVLLELRSPGGEFLLHTCADGGYCFRPAITRASGKASLIGPRAEVVVRITLADINGGETLPVALIASRPPTVRKREASVDQHGLGRTGDEHRGTEEAVRSGGKVFHIRAAVNGVVMIGLLENLMGCLSLYQFENWRSPTDCSRFLRLGVKLEIPNKLTLRKDVPLGKLPLCDASRS